MNYLGSKTIETKRLILKAQTMDEQKYLWSVLMMPEVNKYYLAIPTFLRDKLKDWNKQEPYYMESMKHANDPDIFRWSIFLKEENKCIGRISCHKASDDYDDITDPEIRGVGWYLDSKYQGNGYGTEAASAMIDYMFNEINIKAIRTGAAIVNPASWKIMEKLGFKRLEETQMEQYTFLDDLVECYQYILTKEMYYEKNKYNSGNRKL